MSVADGLPQSFVSGIQQDNQGFIWISTHNGLARYDGHNFHIFRNNPNGEQSISSSFISHSYKGFDGNLWLMYDNGAIDLFNTTTHKTKHIISEKFLEQNKLLLSRRGWLVSRSGMLWFLSENGRIRNFRITDNNFPDKPRLSTFEIPHNHILSIMEDSLQNIWALGDKSLSRFDNKTNTFITYSLPYAAKYDLRFYFGEEIPVLFEQNNGQIMWLDKEYLHFFNPANKQFRRTKLPEPVSFNGKLISKGPNGKVYFQLNKTVYSYSNDSGFTKNTQVDGINDRESQALLVDNSGLIWLAANTDGLYLIDLSTTFKNFKYKEDFIVDLMEKELGISVLNYYDISSADKGLLPPAYYLRYTNKKNGATWVALNRTVGYITTTNRKLIKLPALPPGQTLSFNPIKGICLSGKENLIVIDQANDIFEYSPDNPQWRKIMTGNEIKRHAGSLINPSSLLAEGYNLWIASEDSGLIVIDRQTGKVSHIYHTKSSTAIPSNKLFGMSQDYRNKNIIWIASDTGLISFNTKTLQSSIYSAENGLPDNVIYSIVTDKQGYLWLGTNKGLSRFDTQSYRVKTYTERHGLPCYEFNRYHHLVFPDGQVAFGGVNDGVIFNPKEISDDVFNPQAAIINIKVNNMPFREEEPLNIVTKLELPYNQNTLSIEYAALEYNQPQDLNYRYRLKGYDNFWTTPGNKREAVYTKVPPGDYEFEVNASNTSGRWSNHTKTIKISILPPWWATWWAYTLYFIAIVSLVAVFINYRIRQGFIKNTFILKQKEAEQLREMDAIKTEFFSNMTHELRTPLTLILGPTDQLRKTTDDDAQYLLSIIDKNAKSLLNLTNQLLDLAKLEAGALKPHILYGDLAKEIQQIMGAFREEANITNSIIEYVGPEKAEYAYSPDVLERILYNLIANALKFNSEGVRVVVFLSENSEEGITLSVTDNGKGIPESEITNVFKRFYHKDSGKKETGTGIGLALVKELVELQGGTIKVESPYQEGYGTRFIIFLPLEKSPNILAPNEISYPEPDSIDSGKPADKPIILLVEDNKDLASFIEKSLQKYYTVFRAENGREGIRMALEIMPDLIVSDVLMDIMDGFEMCKHLKENINTDHIPIILLTARSDTSSKLEGLSYKADDYITKPFNFDELLLRINNRLELQNKQKAFLQKKFKVLPEENTASENTEQEAISDVFLKKVYAVIDTRLDDETLSVEDLAAALNMSRTSLHRKLKALTDMSTNEIIKLHRLKTAISLLKKDFNISEVAYKTGFGSPSYFSRCFKDAYNMTPSQYLQNNTPAP